MGQYLKTDHDWTTHYYSVTLIQSPLTRSEDGGEMWSSNLKQDTSQLAVHNHFISCRIDLDDMASLNNQLVIYCLRSELAILVVGT